MVAARKPSTHRNFMLRSFYPPNAGPSNGFLAVRADEGASHFPARRRLGGVAALEPRESVAAVGRVVAPLQRGYVPVFGQRQPLSSLARLRETAPVAAVYDCRVRPPHSVGGHRPPLQNTVSCQAKRSALRRAVPASPFGRLHQGLLHQEGHSEKPGFRRSASLLALRQTARASSLPTVNRNAQKIPSRRNAVAEAGATREPAAQDALLPS